MTDEEKVKILKSTEKLWNEKNRLEELEKENEQLKAQIEKMKCCENCEKHRNCECPEDMKFYARTQKKCNYWECEK